MEERDFYDPSLIYLLSNEMHAGLCFGLQVAMATAAKAKLLLREIKTVKADLAFAKQRCTQLEDENKLLRESRERGQNPADDDLVNILFLPFCSKFKVNRSFCLFDSCQK